MSDYRSAYEKYYKNINNNLNGKKERNNYLPLSSRSNNEMNLRYGMETRLDNKGNYLVRRIIRELIGATLLLIIFFGMKVIPLTSVNDAYSISKQTLSENFEYDKYTEVFSKIEIGDFKLEDITSSNIKAKVVQFIDYLKNMSHIELKTEL